jgi:hypothetical protein
LGREVDARIAAAIKHACIHTCRWQLLVQALTADLLHREPTGRARVEIALL